MKISYLGPKGTYCYDACNLYNKNKEYEIVGANTITESVELLLNDKVEECVVPIENSIKGTVLETLDNIFDNEEIFIKQELILDIEHYLLGYNTNEQEVQKLYSHSQAIGQCKKYIQNKLKKCQLIEVESTAKGAENVKETKSGLCIANKVCAELYDLPIIDENIQDRNNNQTRFFVLTKNRKHKEENVKISLVFSTENKPGALYKILGLINTFEVNMTKIESRPSKTGLGDYWFWIDINIEKIDEKIKVLFDIIKSKCSYFRILGVY